MFKEPWQIEPTGPDEYVVTDLDGRKLFYIKADEGDDTDEIPPSVLGYGEDSDALESEIKRRLSSVT
jgi:hypothetical protein